MAVNLRGGFHGRHHGKGNIQKVQQLAVPLQRVDVEEHCAGSVGDIRDVHFPAGELPDQPGIHGTEAQFSRQGPLAGAGHMVQNPLDFGSGEIGVYDEPRLFANLFHQPFLLEFVTQGRCTAVLPYDGVVHGSTRFGIPDYGGFPLVGDADGGQILAVNAQPGNGLGNDGGLGRPDFHRVVLHPARLGEVLGEFLLGKRTNVSLVIEYDGPGGTGSLVQGQDVLVIHRLHLLSCCEQF